MKSPVTNQDIMEELLVSKKSKQRHQVKSRWYYIFWGAATLSVFAGQLYVGTGYRRMSESFDKIVGTVILDLNPRFHRMEPPEPPYKFLNEAN